jgi:hypothetical protein
MNLISIERDEVPENNDSALSGNQNIPFTVRLAKMFQAPNEKSLTDQMDWLK